MKKLRKIAHHTKMVTLSYLSKVGTGITIVSRCQVRTKRF